MAYTVPPSSAFLAGTTNGVANTDTNHTILAAPGVGNAYLITHAELSYTPNNTGAVECRKANAGDYLHALECGPTGPSVQAVIPEPGFLMAANTALVTASRSNVISQGFRFVVYYYIVNIA